MLSASWFHTLHRIYSVEEPLGICAMTASGSGKPLATVIEADTTQPVSQGSSCHELSSDPLTSGPDS